MMDESYYTSKATSDSLILYNGNSAALYTPQFTENLKTSNNTVFIET